VNLLNAHISLPLEAVGPDPWPFNASYQFRLDHVISRDKEGSLVSIVGDFIWDWTAYEPRGRSAKIYFHYWTSGHARVGVAELSRARIERMRELQQLLLVLIYRQDDGPSLGPGTIKRWLRGLKHLARFAEVRELEVKEVLSQRDELDLFIATVPDSAAFTIVAWLSFLHEKASHEALGFRPARPQRWKDLQSRAQSIRDSLKQTPPLPSRVYASVIVALAEEIESIESHMEQLISLLRASIAEHGRSRKEADGFLGPVLISRYGLEEYFAHRDITPSLHGISSVVGEIFRICKLQIHVFSGMRDTEAQYLPFHCMTSVPQHHGRAHALIEGLTTKLEGGRRRRAKWVTTEEEGFRAIRIAQKFASVLYGCIGISPSYDERAHDDHPLFISPGYLPWAPGVALPADGRVRACNLNISRFTVLRDRICPVIVEQDIAELEKIDPFRAWREEGTYAVGTVWPLRPHQLRRSLSLYANASGLVRLSSLRRQLQHITREMSLYYARGSAFSINFIEEDPRGFRQHVAFDWQNAESESQYLAFVVDVMKSTEPLHGPAGKFYEMKKELDEVITQQVFSRSVKLGRLAYRSSPLGGCTNPGVCETSKGLRLIDTTCATNACKYLVGKHSKIVEVIRLQRAALSRMDVTSLTYQFELEDLNALVATEVTWRPPVVGTEAHKELDDV
jgi:hypothetical protein